MDWSEFRLQHRLALEAEAIEQVYALIAQVDSVKNSWVITQKWQPQTIERLTHHVIVTSSGASNRIEGNRLTDIEVEALYRKLRIQNFKTRDEQEIAGYLEVLSSVFENYQDMPVTESLILQLHRDTLIHSEKDERHRGIYKFGSNRVEAKDQQNNVVGTHTSKCHSSQIPLISQKVAIQYLEFNYAIDLAFSTMLFCIAIVSSGFLIVARA